MPQFIGVGHIATVDAKVAPLGKLCFYTTFSPFPKLPANSGYVTAPLLFVMFNGAFFASSCSDINTMGRVLDVVWGVLALRKAKGAVPYSANRGI